MEGCVKDYHSLCGYEDCPFWARCRGRDDEAAQEAEAEAQIAKWEDERDNPPEGW